MEKIWVLAADNSRARIFETSKRNILENEIETMANPAGRQSIHEIVDDRPGRSPHPASDGGKRVAYAPSSDPKKLEVQQFARTLAKILNNGARDNSFEKLYIIAPPAFLGMIRGELGAQAQKKIQGEIDKNLAQLKMEEIRKHLPQFM